MTAGCGKSSNGGAGELVEIARSEEAGSAHGVLRRREYAPASERRDSHVSFDGVHLGHQAVLREIDRRAREAGRASVLVTFDPHPLEVLNPDAAPPLLTTGAERLEILALSPLDYVVILRFDRRLAGLTPEGFVREVLLERCAVRELVIGHDHGFGRGRSGDVETLRTLEPARVGRLVDTVDLAASSLQQPNTLRSPGAI